MWNEKEFFQDFVEESEKVKPDEDFVQQLKSMMDDEQIAKQEKRRKQVVIMRYATVAAAFLLCVIIGGVTWNFWNKEPNHSEEETNSYTADVHAGNNNHEIQSGVIGITDSELQEAILMVGDEDVVIKGEDGELISAGKRKKLLDMLNRAEKVEEIIEFEDGYTSYFCTSEGTLEIKIYNSEYIQLGDSDSIYQIK